MPRKGRVVLPNHPHHVVQRGHNRQVVFAVAEDYQRYLADLRELKDVFGVKVYAYCLMTHGKGTEKGTDLFFSSLLR
jgi:putative transposase